jgi:hypothetical protein
VILVHGQADLPHVVLAADLVGRLAHALDRGEDQGQQGHDDPNNHQELDEREAAARVMIVAHG